MILYYVFIKYILYITLLYIGLKPTPKPRWLSGLLERSPRMRKIGCLNPNRDMPKS